MIHLLILAVYLLATIAKLVRPTYVVAEEDAATAATILRTAVGPKARIEPIGRASIKLLLSLELSSGEFKKTET